MAMDTFSTNGLTNDGRTKHYAFQYDNYYSNDRVPPTEPTRINAVMEACDKDYLLMSKWFGEDLLAEITINVQVTTSENCSCCGGQYSIGGCWTPSPLTVQIVGEGPQSYIDDPDFGPVYLRYVLITEVTEMFMQAQNGYWYQEDTEGGKGESLSRFLGGQFLALNGFLDSGILAPPPTGFGVASCWLNSQRDDYLHATMTDVADAGPGPGVGCGTLFIYYLYDQLGFTDISKIVDAGAPTLAEVYSNLTMDPGDPFPFFSQLLEFQFPPPTTIPALPCETNSMIPGPNPDDPWPIGILSFVVDKSTFGKDEVTDNSIFSNAFWLILEGFNQQVLGSTMPNLSGPASSLPSVTLSLDTSEITYEGPGAQAPQRVRFPFDIHFSTWPFPASASLPVEEILNGSISIPGTSPLTAATVLTFVAGADPYFTNVDTNADPTQNNEYWLSQDLRVFTATPGMNNQPVPNGPVFETDTTDPFGAAYSYIQDLLTYLNKYYSDPNGTDPFNDASNVIPGQTEAYTADSSVTPGTSDNPNYNFAIARVRLRGSGSMASNVKVFFRLWITQTLDTDYQPDTTYYSTPDASNNPGSPLPAPDHSTFPFFATGNSPTSLEYKTMGVNNKNIMSTSEDGIWTYFGCFLNVYDPSNMLNSQQEPRWMGTHHCLVAQIAYDEAPIAVGESPENSDKLAQRNLQVTPSSNPGVPATHLIPQTFDLRPSLPIILGQDPLLRYPDELMIDWGNTPLGSTASIYWPQVNVSEVLQLASRLYASHLLSAADPHTIQCKVTRGVTYVPIPAGSGQNFAGLLTIDLPSTVVKGQEFNMVIRRISTRRLPEELPPPTAFGGRPIRRSRRQQEFNWRYVIGTFQVKIPVSTAEALLPAEEHTLAILKWRLQAMSPTNRWYPVLQRYVGYVSARVEGLGGDPKAIKPSLGKE